MPRTQKPVRPILIDYVCDECGEGVYEYTGSMRFSNPPRIEHRCDACGDIQYFFEKYPTIRYCNEGEMIDLENYKEQPL